MNLGELRHLLNSVDDGNALVMSINADGYLNSVSGVEVETHEDTHTTTVWLQTEDY